MSKIIAGILIFVGLINFYPTIGVLSAEILTGLYKIEIPNSDTQILLRHRAVLFGLLGAFIVYSAFKPELQWLAIASGLISMLSFVVVALLVGNYGAGIRTVVIADVVASIGLLAVVGLRLWSKV